jgi:hypothetical protein
MLPPKHIFVDSQDCAVHAWGRTSDEHRNLVVGSGLAQKGVK